MAIVATYTQPSPSRATLARQARLHRAHRHLVAPVEAFLVPSLAALEANLAAGVSDPLIGEAADQPPKRVRAPVAIGVGEGQDPAPRLRHRPVEGCDLAAP